MKLLVFLAMYFSTKRLAVSWAFQRSRAIAPPRSTIGCPTSALSLGKNCARSSSSSNRRCRTLRTTTTCSMSSPASTVEWSLTGGHEKIDYADLEQAGVDVYRTFVQYDPSRPRRWGGETSASEAYYIRNDGGSSYDDWGPNQQPLSDFAQSLIGHQVVLDQVLYQLDQSSRTELGTTEKPMPETVEGNDCIARHLGSGIVALENIPQSPFKKFDTDIATERVVLSQPAFRRVVEQSMTILKRGQSVFVSVQEGSGQARSGLLGCLSALLTARAPVMYHASAPSYMYLFIPNPNGGYLGWCDRWSAAEASILLSDRRMIVLLDSFEHDFYNWECDARVVEFCVNKEGGRLIFDNYPAVVHLYASPPTLPQVLAMRSVLWNDTASNMPGLTESPHSDAEVCSILTMRAHLVGCAPRYLFDYKQFKRRLYEIQNAIQPFYLGTDETTEQRLRESMKPRLRRHVLSTSNSNDKCSAFPIHVPQSLVKYPPYFYNLRVGPAVAAASDDNDAMSPRAAVSMNGYTKAQFLRRFLYQGLRRSEPYPWPYREQGTDPVSVEEMEDMLTGYLAVGGMSFGMVEDTWDYDEWDSSMIDVTIPSAAVANGGTTVVVSPFGSRTAILDEAMIASVTDVYIVLPVVEQVVVVNSTDDDSEQQQHELRKTFQGIVEHVCMSRTNKTHNLTFTVFAPSPPYREHPDWLPPDTEWIIGLDKKHDLSGIRLLHWPNDQPPNQLTHDNHTVLLAPFFSCNGTFGLPSDSTPAVIQALYAECMYQATTNLETYQALCACLSKRD